MRAAQNGSGPVFSRRAVNKKLSGVSLGAAMVLLEARGKHAYAVAAMVGRKWVGGKAWWAYDRIKTRWASWDGASIECARRMVGADGVDGDD